MPLIEETEQTKAAPWAALLLSALGFVEFAVSEHEAVDRALLRMRQQLDSSGARETLLDRSEPFHIESLLALGELDRARATLERLEERSRTLPRLWIDVTLPRARALVLAAEGDVGIGLAALNGLDLEAAARLPFELGWALLIKGRLLRRLKQRRAAGETLREALELFARLGAPAWAEQTRSELARVAPRRRAPGELTATELRVAELAAAGLTNREVAKVAFISAKTVEANLARVYRKHRKRGEARRRHSSNTTAPRHVRGRSTSNVAEAVSRRRRSAQNSDLNGAYGSFRVKEAEMLTVPRFVFAVAAIAASLAVAAPASAETTLTYQATFVENAGGQATCPPGTSCGSATISGFGHVAYQIVRFNACGPNCHIRTITFDDGSTLRIRESVTGTVLPGSSAKAGANAPTFLEISQTILGGTGIFEGATGSGTGRVNLAADAIIHASGTITLAD